MKADDFLSSLIQNRSLPRRTEAYVEAEEDLTVQGKAYYECCKFVSHVLLFFSLMVNIARQLILTNFWSSYYLMTASERPLFYNV